MFYLLLILVVQVFCEADDVLEWNSMDLHCKNNENKAVDWWFLYKPPSGDGPWESGRNFTYITSNDSGKWKLSRKDITSSSMLLYTFSPLLEPTYSDYIAQLSYRSKKSDDNSIGSSANGILLADDTGGLWIMHTIPKLAEIIQNRVGFSEEEVNKGHMVMCLSADLATLNEIAKSLQIVQPEILNVKIPLSVNLPYWKNVGDSDWKPIMKPSLQLAEFHHTNGSKLTSAIIARPPGNHRCLYKSFALSMKIVLDAYGHDVRSKTFCDNKYSIRKINSISLKYPDIIYYVNNKTDSFGFAVSTAAHWQRRGSATGSHYWVCVGTMENEDRTGKGGLIICLEDYLIWRSFDMLKVKEPEC